MKIDHVILSDLHYPLHNEQAIRKLLRELSGAVISNLHLLGDIYDFAAFSRFLKTPKEIAEAPTTLQSAKEFATGIITKLQPAKTYFYIGNHEERLVKYILRNAPALHGVVDYSAITPPGSTLVDHRWGQVISSAGRRIRFLHGGLVRRNPGATPLEHLRAFPGEDIVVGHSHRLSCVFSRGYFGVEAGHLSRPEAHGYCRVPPDWTCGYAVITNGSPRVIQT